MERHTLSTVPLKCTSNQNAIPWTVTGVVIVVRQLMLIWHALDRGDGVLIDESGEEMRG